MKQVYRFDDQGRYLEPVIIQEGEKIPFDCTEKELPQPNWKPIFKDGSWIETITEEEKDHLYNQAVPKSEIEILREQNEDLNLQIITIWETLIDGGILS